MALSLAENCQCIWYGRCIIIFSAHERGDAFIPYVERRERAAPVAMTLA